MISNSIPFISAFSFFSIDVVCHSEINLDPIGLLSINNDWMDKRAREERKTLWNI